MNSRIPLQSTVSPRDTWTQPFRIVLHNTGRDWVTHCENLTETPAVPLGYASEVAGQTVIRTESGEYQSKAPDKDFYWGHYFGNDYNAALEDYRARCLKYGLK